MSWTPRSCHLMEVTVSNSHFITLCSCGQVIAQCRCPSGDKRETVIERGCEQCKSEAAMLREDYR